jgi:hypothetical protein
MLCRQIIGFGPLQYSVYVSRRSLVKFGDVLPITDQTTGQNMISVEAIVANWCCAAEAVGERPGTSGLKKRPALAGLGEYQGIFVLTIPCALSNLRTKERVLQMRQDQNSAGK